MTSDARPSSAPPSDDRAPVGHPSLGQGRSPSRLFRWLAPPALAAVVVLLYWPTVAFKYVALDDTLYVQTNRLVHRGLTTESVARAFTDTRVGYWTPLLWISYMADVQFQGLSASAFHRTNVLLHGLVAALLLLLLTEMTGRPWPSLAAAALYALHPLRVEAVAWIAGRKDVLSMALFLPSLFAYARYARSGRWRHYAAMLLFFVLGMMVKPVLMTLPLLLLLLDVWPLGRTPFWDAPPSLAAPKRSWAFLAIEKAPVLAASAAFAVSAARLQGDALYLVEGDFSAWSRAKMAATSYIGYLGKTLWPVDLPLLDFILPYRVPSAWVAAPSFLAFCVLTWAAARQVRRRPWLTVGWGWYFVALLPVSGLAPAGLQWMADRFTYVPHLMLPVAAAFWASGWAAGRVWPARAMSAATLAACALLAVLSLGQMSHWKNGVTLFSRSVERDPRDYLSWLQLGIAQGMDKRLEEAETSFRKVIELKPYYLRGHFYLGMTYLDEGRYEDAARKFTEVLKNDPTFSMAHFSLAKALNKLGDPDGTERHLREFLRLEPGSDVAVDSLTILGVVKATRGEMEEAMAFLGEALDREPLFPQAHYNLALALLAQGRDEEAEPHLRAALKGDPRLRTVFITLTEEIEAQGRLREAAAHLARYLDLFPQDEQATALSERLGILYVRMGDRREATAWFRRAAEGDPKNIIFLLNLAENLYLLGDTVQASPLYLEVAGREPLSAEAAFAKGRLLLIEGKTSDAAASFREGLLRPSLHQSTRAALRSALAEKNSTGPAAAAAPDSALRNAP